MEILLLSIGSLISFIRPVWGIAFLILVTSSLFHLSQYMTIPLHVGYMEPTEVILFTLCVRLWFWKYPRRKGQLEIQVDSTTIKHELLVKRVLLSAIVPYIIWQSFALFLGIVTSSGIEHFRFAIRFFLNGIFPWTIVWIVWQLRSYKDKIFFSVAFITVITVILHIAIQVSDYRPLMALAYWRAPTLEYSVMYESRMQWVESYLFVRGLPQGSILILFFSVYYFSEYITGYFSRNTAFALSMICLAALIITFTRSLVFAAICGCFIAMLLAYYYQVFNISGKIRAIKWVTALVLMVGMYGVFNPFFLDFWQERLSALETSSDVKIFSDENPARGLDNLASIDAISDSPFLGYGSPRYSDHYSYRYGPPTDIHPLLQIGLIGGIPAILLLLRLLFLVIRKIGLPVKREWQKIIRVLPFTTILIMTAGIVNTIGAGGTLSGNGLIAMCLFIGFLAVYYPGDFESPQEKVK